MTWGEGREEERGKEKCVKRMISEIELDGKRTKEGRGNREGE